MEALIDFFLNLFSTDGYTPRGEINGMSQSLIYVAMVSDAIIAVSFFSSAVLLYYLWHRSEAIPLKFSTIVFIFFFIVYGIENSLSVTAYHWPIFRFFVLMKMICCLSISIVTILMVKDFPIRLRYYRYKEELTALKAEIIRLKEATPKGTS